MKMTEQEVQAVITALSSCATTLTRTEMKQIYRMLIARGIFPKCVACGSDIMTEEDFSWDHIYPKSKGGKNDVANLQPMHKICNELKGNIVDLDGEFFEHMAPDMIDEVMEDIHKKVLKNKKSHKKNNTFSKSETEVINSYKYKKPKKKKKRQHLRANGWDTTINRVKNNSHSR